MKAADREQVRDMSAELNAALAKMFDRYERERVGEAVLAQWPAEDGWLIHYSTSRVRGGPCDGKFAVMAYKPEGKGSRSGRPEQWVMVYQRAYSTRKAAKARAIALYRKHSPKWNARHPERRV